MASPLSLATYDALAELFSRLSIEASDPAPWLEALRVLTAYDHDGQSWPSGALTGALLHALHSRVEASHTLTLAVAIGRFLLWDDPEGALAQSLLGGP